MLNANYLLARLREAYDLPFDRLCMHEFVLSARNLKREHGITALDVAKRLMDYGFHPPTVYFPLIVPEALMIEPTETETKETLDAFAEAMLEIAREAADDPERAQGGAAPTVRSGGWTRSRRRSARSSSTASRITRTWRANPSPPRSVRRPRRPPARERPDPLDAHGAGGEARGAGGEGTPAGTSSTAIVEFAGDADGRGPAPVPGASCSRSGARRRPAAYRASRLRPTKN